MENRTYPQAVRIVDQLVQRGWHITFAETCTGGSAASGIVDVPGASSVFDGSFVTYANEAKIRYLGVDPACLETYGAVSEPVAAGMAKGAAEAFGSETAVAISGISGPHGGTDRKPVGTVCFGFYIRGVCITETRFFGPLGRSGVRDAAVSFAYDTLLRLLEK